MNVRPAWLVAALLVSGLAVAIGMVFVWWLSNNEPQAVEPQASPQVLPGGE